MFNFFKPFRVSSTELTDSTMFDEKTFFQKFINDLQGAKEEVIIESPFITIDRMKKFVPVLQDLVSKNILIYIITRYPQEHSNEFTFQAEEAIRWCENNGIQVLVCKGKHHRKLAIIDKKIVYEGSLNILSQLHSREIMRRIDDKSVTEETIKFFKFDAFL